MKIAFLTPEYPHARTGNSGGIGTSIKNLAESLTTLGHNVRILVYGQKEDAVFEADSENEDAAIEDTKIQEVNEVEEIKVVTKLTMPSRRLKVRISTELLQELEKMQINFKLN